jgi:hypothetical protein
VNGVRLPTGVLSFDYWLYSYSSVDLPTFAFQFSFSSYNGWGDALKATISGAAAASGACVLDSSSFLPQPVTPFLTLRSGESFYRTTATALGASGYCKTTWNVPFANPGYDTPTLTVDMLEIRCDNATGANTDRPARVGCVVPWYPSAAFYSQSAYPSLASHVARAQNSGLPGATFAAPLVRTTNQATIDTNRRLACGDAPSIPGRNCDEYPLATTRQGLAAGGTRRTFDGCDINAPTGVTGPTGASACMITASENFAQGGIMSGFYYDWRVLDGDPYLVHIAP